MTRALDIAEWILADSPNPQAVEAAIKLVIAQAVAATWRDAAEECVQYAALLKNLTQPGSVQMPLQEYAAEVLHAQAKAFQERAAAIRGRGKT